jgi:hypothetical protein
MPMLLAPTKEPNMVFNGGAELIVSDDFKAQMPIVISERANPFAAKEELACFCKN